MRLPLGHKISRYNEVVALTGPQNNKMTQWFLRLV